MAQHDDKETEEGRNVQGAELDGENYERDEHEAHLITSRCKQGNSHERKRSQRYVWMVLCAKVN